MCMASALLALHKTCQEILCFLLYCLQSTLCEVFQTSTVLLGCPLLKTLAHMSRKPLPVTRSNPYTPTTLQACVHTTWLWLRGPFLTAGQPLRQLHSLIHNSAMQYSGLWLDHTLLTIHPARAPYHQIPCHHTAPRFLCKHCIIFRLKRPCWVAAWPRGLCTGLSLQLTLLMPHLHNESPPNFSHVTSITELFHHQKRTIRHFLPPKCSDSPLIFCFSSSILHPPLRPPAGKTVTACQGQCWSSQIVDDTAVLVHSRPPTSQKQTGPRLLD